TTGFDPAARRELWDHLASLKGTAILVATHLLDEAERCDRLAILDGKIVAEGTPASLRAEIAGDVVLAEGDGDLARDIESAFGVKPSVVDGRVRIEIARG